MSLHKWVDVRVGDVSSEAVAAGADCARLALSVGLGEDIAYKSGPDTVVYLMIVTS